VIEATLRRGAAGASRLRQGSPASRSSGSPEPIVMKAVNIARRVLAEKGPLARGGGENDLRGRPDARPLFSRAGEEQLPIPFDVGSTRSPWWREARRYSPAASGSRRKRIHTIGGNPALGRADLQARGGWTRSH